MKKFLLGLLCGILLAGVVGVVAALVFARIGDSKPTIAGGSTLVLHLEGDLPERPSTDLGLPFGPSDNQVTVTELWQQIRAAGKDSKVKALILMPRGFAGGWAKTEELRANLAEFKKSGKPVYAFLRAPRTPDYLVASSADKVFVVPGDLMDIKGLRAEITYYRGLMGKLGVELQATHAGKYKDALDSFTRNDMSPETREVYTSLIDNLYNHLVQVISQNRKLSEAAVKAAVDEGPLLAERAKELKLVDDVLYEDQFFDFVKSKIGGELKKVDFSTYARSNSGGRGARIAVVVEDGEIVRGATGGSPFGEQEMITVSNSAASLREVAKTESIKGVILRVNSPGGDAVASAEILREVQQLSKKKPVVISMGDVAASGGYYISMTGDPVVAYPNTITGSIGVIYGKVNLRGLYEKLGLTKDTVKRGLNASIDSEYYPLDAAGQKKLQEGVDTTYQTFLEVVSAGRKKKVEEIAPYAQGRVWLGAQAKANGLVDELGGLDKALTLIRAKAKLSSDEPVRIMLYPPKKTLLEQLLQRSTDEGLNAQARMLQEKLLREKLREITGGLPLEALRQSGTRGGLFMLLPYPFPMQ